jgi:hypothetical protein
MAFEPTNPQGLNIHVNGGALLISGVDTPIATATVIATANTTSYVYIPLSTGVITVGSSFPATNVYPIATVTAGPTTVLSLVDSRPDVFTGAVIAPFSSGVIDASSPTYGMKWDAKQLQTANFTNGSNVVTTTTPTFAASDVGKAFWAFTKCVGDDPTPTFTPAIVRTTITGFTSSTQVSVGANASANPASANTGCIIFGTPDDAALALLEAAAAASLTCPIILFPPAGTILEFPHFIQSVPACNATAQNKGENLIGWGQTFAGWGKGVSILFLSPNFASNIAGCTGGITGKGCFFGQPGMHLRGFQFQGGAMLSTGFASQKNIVEFDTDSLVEDVGFYMFGGNDTNVQMQLTPIGEVNFTNVATMDFGTGWGVNTAGGRTGGFWSLNHTSLGGHCKTGLVTLGTSVELDSFNSFFASGNCSLVNWTFITMGAGSRWKSHSDLVFQDGGSLTQYGVQPSTSSGAVVDLYGTQIASTYSVLTNQPITVNCHGCQMSGAVFLNNAAAVFNDFGGGTFNSFSGSGVVNGVQSLIGNQLNTSVASRNTLLGATTLLAAGASVTGQNSVLTLSLYAYDSAAGASCTGNTTVTWTISYTDPTNTVQTQTAVETITTNGGATGGDKLQQTFTFQIKGGTAVTYSTAYTPGSGCVTNPSYAAQLTVK